MVIWLTGVDYFSTIGYQPGIALLAAGAVSPIATAILVAVTLLCALPIYAQVAGRSYAGLGSIAMLENILPGWPGKVMVLVLLGFAATDFVITMTLSASDAAQHATQNPYLQTFLHDANLPVTLVLLALLAAVFLKGFKEAIELAAAVCVPYIVLNAVVMGRALFVVSTHPAAFPDWLDALRAQGGAYATGVLVLMFSASVAASLSLWKEGQRAMSLYCWGVVLVFGYTTVANIIERRDGIVIASIFILLILTISGVSRYWRATELRVGGHHFTDAQSEALWKEMAEKKVNMVPVRSLEKDIRDQRVRKVRSNYNVKGDVALVHLELLDNRSEFLTPLQITVTKDGEEYLVEATQAVAIANGVAYLSEILHPRSLYLGLSRQNLMRQSFRYFLLGEGETGLMVYTILQHHWEVTPYEDVRPCIYLMSD